MTVAIKTYDRRIDTFDMKVGDAIDGRGTHRMWCEFPDRCREKPRPNAREESQAR